jgi:putative endonuclease
MGFCLESSKFQQNERVVERAGDASTPLSMTMTHYRERRSYCVYILGSLSGTLYIGVTGRLDTRIVQHKQHTFAGFTSKYGADRLLYWESYDDVHKAIGREKQLKGWRREKKVALIELVNPHWVDLSKDSRPWTKASPLSS